MKSWAVLKGIELKLHGLVQLVSTNEKAMLLEGFIAMVEKVQQVREEVARFEVE